MPLFQLFVDTGLSGACVLFEQTQPLRAFRFKKNFEGRGIQLKPFINFLNSLPSETIPIIEDPAKVQRSLTSTSTQYIVVGQIISAIEMGLHADMEWVSSNSWTALTKRVYKGRRFKDSKERSKAFAFAHYPTFGQKDGKLHDGIADCLCMAKYYFLEQEKILDRMKD